MSTTILIVDDSEEIRFTLKEICTYADWDVLEASNGKEAVEIFKLISPDLVLLDYHMPHGDGLQTTKRIRQINKKVPILILTVDEQQKVADSFLEAGATDFALKPFRAPDLISRIRLNLKLGYMGEEEENSAFVVKGINDATLFKIKKFLLNQKKGCTLNEIEESLPFAYQTIHRYLDYLVKQGEVIVKPEYGNKGRPKNNYSIKREPI